MYDAQRRREKNSANSGATKQSEDFGTSPFFGHQVARQSGHQV
jgi:hypothetical protein